MEEGWSGDGAGWRGMEKEIKHITRSLRVCVCVLSDSKEYPGSCLLVTNERSSFTVK